MRECLSDPGHQTAGWSFPEQIAAPLRTAAHHWTWRLGEAQSGETTCVTELFPNHYTWTWMDCQANHSTLWPHHVYTHHFLHAWLSHELNCISTGNTQQATANHFSGKVTPFPAEEGASTMERADRERTMKRADAETNKFLLARTEAVEDMTFELWPLQVVVTIGDGVMWLNHRQNLGKHVDCSEKKKRTKRFADNTRKTHQQTKIRSLQSICC